MDNDNTQGTQNTDNSGKGKKDADKRKQSLYLPDDMLQSLQEEAARLDRSLSWVVQRCIKMGLASVKALPSMTDE